jgi:glycerol-3-phosphate cytidylyltransferase
MIIGYTTGVFDLFHIGHLNILKAAKAQCDHLIVGVTTDELSLERKGKLPIIPFSERVSIVSSIKYVDEVVAQDSMDKMAAGINTNLIKCLLAMTGKVQQNGTNLRKNLIN